MFVGLHRKESWQVESRRLADSEAARDHARERAERAEREISHLRAERSEQQMHHRHEVESLMKAHGAALEAQASASSERARAQNHSHALQLEAMQTKYGDALMKLQQQHEMKIKQLEAQSGQQLTRLKTEMEQKIAEQQQARQQSEAQCVELRHELDESRTHGERVTKELRTEQLAHVRTQQERDAAHAEASKWFVDFIALNSQIHFWFLLSCIN